MQSKTLLKVKAEDQLQYFILFSFINSWELSL